MTRRSYPARRVRLWTSPRSAACCRASVAKLAATRPWLVGAVRLALARAAKRRATDMLSAASLIYRHGITPDIADQLVGGMPATRRERHRLDHGARLTITSWPISR